MCEVGSGVCVAGVGQSRPVAVGAQTVRAACADVAHAMGDSSLSVSTKYICFSISVSGLPSAAPAGENVLEGRCCRQTGRLFQRTDELPRVECVTEVDITRLAVEYLNRKFASVIKMRAGFWLGLQPYFKANSFINSPFCSSRRSYSAFLLRISCSTSPVSRST